MIRKAICLMGPTASGKTEIAISLCKRFPCDIISVDSALVYRGMDIGTAKPDAETLRRTPHRLVNIRDPEDSYSAGDFVRDARSAIEEIQAAGRIPLLVGGTMMYFRVLTEGIANLPPADQSIRAAIDAEAEKFGWPHMHRELDKVDTRTAARLNPNDSQRIQRALEVLRSSGMPLSDWHDQAPDEQDEAPIEFVKIALQISNREILHERIGVRLEHMFESGLVQEVENLRQRKGLRGASPSMRSVGYRQVWSHLSGDCDLDEARYKALVATRQLAKRQLTWLRSESSLESFDPLEADVIGAISTCLSSHLA